MTQQEAMQLIGPFERERFVDAVRFFGCEEHGDDEVRENDAVIELGDGHSGTGIYVWCSEYPEDGAQHFSLDPTMRSVRGNRRVAARLAEVQRRSLYRFRFVCAGCMDHQEAAPIYADWECGNCECTGRLHP